MNPEKLTIEALHQAYLDACNKKDYATCDKIKIKMDLILRGREYLFPCEKKLDADFRIFS